MSHYLYLTTSKAVESFSENNKMYLINLPENIMLSEKNWELALLECELPSVGANATVYLTCDIVEPMLVFSKFVSFIRKLHFTKKNRKRIEFESPYYFKIRNNIKSIRFLKVNLIACGEDKIPVFTKPLNLLLHLRESEK